MGIDKVIDSAQLDGAMQATAEAIRTKSKSTDPIPWNMDKGFEAAVLAIEGGGAELNFEIVGGTVEPVDPVENTIWVNTETEITGWVFSEKEPTNPVEGLVWFVSGTYDPININALKKNEIHTSFGSTFQYISESWVDKTADTLVYQPHEWVEMWNGGLYDAGNEFVDITGGWQKRAWISMPSGGGSANAGTLTKNEDCMVYTLPDCGSGVVEVAKDVDLTGWDTIHFHAKVSAADALVGARGLVLRRNAQYWLTNAQGVVKFGDQQTYTDMTIDISGGSFDGKYDIAIGFAPYTSSGSVTIYKVWLTKELSNEAYLY